MVLLIDFWQKLLMKWVFKVKQLGLHLLVVQFLLTIILMLI